MILFIDELHTVVGAGAAEGAMDASNLLKPMLARGELHTIGATTLDEYRKHIEKDAALERRFQPVFVDEPTVEETISILRGLRERYEVHHGVRITDSALVAAATLSHRYITERFLPDKAIDLVDEAASKLRMEIDSMPAELDELERRRIQLEIEREALRKEKDDASKARLEALEKELADIEEQSGAMKQRWEAEKAAIQAIRATKEELEQLQVRIDQAQRETDYETAAKLRYGTLPELQEHLAGQEAALAALQGPGSMLNEEVTADDIAGHRRRVDRHPGQQAARGRDGQARPHGGAAARAGRRPARGDRGRVGRGPARARRPEGPQAPDRLVPVPRPDRRRQDRAGACAGGVPVRRRARAGPHRHERVHGEVLRAAAHRRASRATSATRRAARSPRPCAGGRTRWCCSTRSRRRTRTCSTCCCRCSTTGA